MARTSSLGHGLRAAGQALSNDKAFMWASVQRQAQGAAVRGYSCPAEQGLGEGSENRAAAAAMGPVRAATSSCIAFSFQLPSWQCSSCLRLASAASATFFCSRSYGQFWSALAAHRGRAGLRQLCWRQVAERSANALHLGLGSGPSEPVDMPRASKILPLSSTPSTPPQPAQARRAIAHATATPDARRRIPVIPLRSRAWACATALAPVPAPPTIRLRRL